jgi:ribose 5-phosphate isomerase RpiB
VSREDAVAIVDTYLTTPFDGGRHVRRIEMIDEV